MPVTDCPEFCRELKMFPTPSSIARPRANAYRRKVWELSWARQRVPEGGSQMTSAGRWLAPATCALLIALGSIDTGSSALAQDCSNRGQLDTLYCDENNDLVADTPTDPRKWKDPATLVFAYTPVEDPAVYQNIFKPFTEYLAQCTS